MLVTRLKSDGPRREHKFSPVLAGSESLLPARNRRLSHAQKIVKFSSGPDIDSGGQFCRAIVGGTGFPKCTLQLMTLIRGI